MRPIPILDLLLYLGLPKHDRRSLAAPSPSVTALAAGTQSMFAQMSDLAKRSTAEVIGTFCLVFAGTGAIVINDVSGGRVTHVGVALTFGLVVMSMIYAVGDVSGAHLNPAVTVGFWIAKRLPGRAVVPYILSQIVGAFAASGVLRVVFLTHDNLGATIPSGAAWQSFVLEVVLTSMLMFVILAVSSGAKEKGLMAGIAVGGVIGFEALFAGPICGASMNPARSLAPAIVSGNVTALWVYLAAPLVGAALGVGACKLVHPPGCCQGGGQE